MKDQHHQDYSHQPPTEDRPNRRQWKQAFSDGPALQNNRAQKSALGTFLDEGHGCLNCLPIARSQSVARLLVLCSALVRGMHDPFVEGFTPPMLHSRDDEGIACVCRFGLSVELLGPILSELLLLSLLLCRIVAAFVGRVRRRLVSRLVSSSFLIVLFELINFLFKVSTSAFNATTSSCLVVFKDLC
jgi:hypothetical protein